MALSKSIHGGTDPTAGFPLFVLGTCKGWDRMTVTCSQDCGYQPGLGVGQGHVPSKNGRRGCSLLCILAILRADILREIRCIACFFASEHTVGQGPSENEPFPALPQHLGRFCKHFTTPVYEYSLMLATRQIEPNLEY